MGSAWRGSSRTRRFTKKTLAFIVPLALIVSMMLSNAPLASAQDSSPSPTADPSSTATDQPTTAPTLAPSASDAPLTAAPSPTDTASPTDASPAPAPAPTDTSSAPSPSDTSSAPAPSVTTTQAVTNSASLIVQTIAGLTDADIADAIAAGGGTEVSSIPALHLHVVDVNAATVADSLTEYRADPRVESVDRDRTRDAEATPNDPAYVDQWALPQIGWDQAYGSTTISGISTIAVLDTGVQSSDVPSGPGWSAFGTDPGTDPNGHGTWIASIAGATTGNGQGIAGVGFDGINIMPVQVLDPTGTGQDSDIIAGLVWAADHGANVAVMAFSNPGYSTALQDAVNYAWAHGVVVVAAAGNDGGTSPNYPAGDARVVGVGATGNTDALWSGSNSSAAVFITAPGVGVTADDTIANTVSVTGTSASAAVVAGAAAQLEAVDPSATPGIIVGRLARNADPDGGVGNGRVNLARALGDTSTDPVVPAGAPGGGPLVGPYVVGAPATNLDQCANGPLSGPVPCTGSAWQNGNLNANEAHYREGESIPFRVVLSGVSAGTHTLDIEYDNTLNNGLHAYDYLTSFDRTEATANPCSGVSPCVAGAGGAIPSDSNLAAAVPPVPQVPGSIAIYNGAITSVVYLSRPPGPEGSALSTSMRITLTTSSPTVVLAWGAHVSTELEWGPGDTIGNATGSSYHMRILAFDGAGGNQDRGAKVGAVLPIPTKATTASASSINVGGSVTDTASFTGSPTPQGTATFFLCGPSTSAPDCSFNGSQLGSAVALNGSGAATSIAFTPTLSSQAGVYCFRAQYTPAASSPYSPGVHTNTTTECFAVTAAPGLTTKTSASSILSGSVTDTATLTQTGQLGTVNGTVSFFVCGPFSSATSCPTGGAPVGSAVNVSGGSATSAAFAPATPGVYCFRAEYTPASGSNYLSTSHTNTTTECFSFGPTPSLALTKADNLNPAFYDHVGQVVTYTLTATNTGNTTLHAVTVSDSPVLAGFSCKVGATVVTLPVASLAPGASIVCTGTHSITQGDLDAGKFDDTASASSTEATATDANDEILASQTKTLTIVKTTNGSDGLVIPVGTAITWKYHVTNTGNVTLTSVTVTDNMLAPAAIDCGGGSNVIASLAPTVSHDCTATGTAVAGHYTNTGTATGTPPTSGNVTATDNSDYYSTPRLIVIKHVINNDGGTATASQFTLKSGGINASPATFPGNEAGTTVTLDAGGYGVTETGPSGYTSSFSADCTGSIANGQTKTCTVTNNDKTKVHVTKTVLGQPITSATDNFQLQIRQGASTSPLPGGDGTILSTEYANLGNGGSVYFTTPPSNQNGKVDPGETELTLAPGAYQLCELVPAGYGTSLVHGTYGVDWFTPGLDPANQATSSIDNSYVCNNFTIQDGDGGKSTTGHVELRIDNRPPSMGRTIGYWKNWASCTTSSTNKLPNLDRTMAKLEPGGIPVGIITLHGSTSTPDKAPDCLKAVRLLGKSTIDTNKKMSSDPGFNFAAQYIAFKLNLALGTNPGCTVANDAASLGQAILVANSFNGTANYKKLTTTQASQLNSYASTLDHYNNDTLTTC